MAPYQDPESHRVMVPMRTLFETLGASVEWDAANRQIIAIKSGIRIILKVGSSTVNIDGGEVQLDAPVKIVNGRTFVPLRFITEQFGGTVQWNEEKRQVSLSIETLD